MLVNCHRWVQPNMFFRLKFVQPGICRKQCFLLFQPQIPATCCILGNLKRQRTVQIFLRRIFDNWWNHSWNSTRASNQNRFDLLQMFLLRRLRTHCTFYDCLCQYNWHANRQLWRLGLLSKDRQHTLRLANHSVQHVR